MKFWGKALLGSGIVSLIVLGIFLTLTIAFNLSWWWVGIPLIIIIVIYLFFLLLFLGWYIGRKKDVVYEEDIKNLKDRVINDMKEDLDNPDNFCVEKEGIIHEGMSGRPSPIAFFDGHGSELGERRVVLINQTNPNKKRVLIKPEDEEIIDAYKKLADFPLEYEPEELTRRDSFGNIIEILKTKRLKTQAEALEEEEKKEVEKKEEEI